MSEALRLCHSTTALSSLGPRLRRYAFGCSELLFHPLRQWPFRGPFTRLFRQYLTAGGIPLSTKMSVIAYVCIYIGALLCLAMRLMCCGAAGFIGLAPACKQRALSKSDHHMRVPSHKGTLGLSPFM